MFQMERGSYTYVHAKGGRLHNVLGKVVATSRLMRAASALKCASKARACMRWPRNCSVSPMFANLAKNAVEASPRAVGFAALTGDEKRVIAHNAGAVPKPCARASSTNTRPPAKQSGSGLASTPAPDGAHAAGRNRDGNLADQRHDAARAAQGRARARGAARSRRRRRAAKERTRIAPPHAPRSWWSTTMSTQIFVAALAALVARGPRPPSTAATRSNR